jgi:hypothetical protein
MTILPQADYIDNLQLMKVAGAFQRTSLCLVPDKEQLVRHLYAGDLLCDAIGPLLRSER